jgi:hypothetical protein
MRKISLAVLLLMLTGQAAHAMTFSDVTAGTLYSEEIGWLAENGVVQGYGDGSFGPDNCVRRAELK